MDETGSADSVHEMESGHPGRRRAVLGLAGVLAFALLVAGVGVLATRNGGSIRLPMLPAAGTEAAARSADAAPTGAGASAALAPAGPVSYQLQGALPALADHAPAFRLNVPDVGAVSTLASAFGLKGTPQRTAGQWVVQEGTRLLTVGTDPAATWAYTTDSHCEPVQSTQMGMACAAEPPVGFGVVSPGTAGQSSGASGQASGAAGQASGASGHASGTSSQASGPTAATGCGGPPSCPVTVTVPCAVVENSSGAPPSPCPTITVPARPADAPTVVEAISDARVLLGRLHVDATNAAITTVETLTGWQVEFAPEVSGLPVSGFDWHVDVGPKGTIEGAGGWLGRPTLLGSYPLIGVQAAFDRLQSGNGGPGGVVPMMGAPAIACPAPGPPNTPATRAPVSTTATPAPANAPPMTEPVSTTVTTSRPISSLLPYCRPRVVTITGAKLGLRLALSPTEAVLEPVYLFQVAPQGELPVVATVDRLLTPPSPIKAQPVPLLAPIPAQPAPAPAQPAPAPAQPAPAPAQPAPAPAPASSPPQPGP